MEGITDAVTGVIGDWGLYAVFVLMLVDSVLPAASELVMVYAGAVAAGAFPGQDVTVFGASIESTAWAYVAMAAAGTLGYTVGCVVGWGIGYAAGRPFLERHGRWLHVTPERLERAERWFERYDEAAAFIGRLLPVVRSFISIPAGLFEMRFGRYTLLSFLGTIPWCFGLAGVGLAVGASWEHFHHSWRYADYAVVGALAVGLLLVLLRVRQHRIRRRVGSERAG